MKQSDKKGHRNQIGAYGEAIAAKYLARQGWTVLEQNYLRKWGELDLVAREMTAIGTLVHFVEVKTVSYETRAAFDQAVSHETWRPEEQVTARKLARMQRAIATWLADNQCDSEWVIDVAAVRIVPRERHATIKFIPNVV